VTLYEIEKVRISQKIKKKKNQNHEFIINLYKIL